MKIHSHRERDRLAREQQKKLEDAHKQHIESLDAMDKIWQTTRGTIDINHIDFDEDSIPFPINDDEDYEFFVNSGLNPWLGCGMFKA